MPQVRRTLRCWRICSSWFPIEIGADGRFGYERQALYWTEPERRFAFLIKSGERVAGFVLVTRGSPVSDDPNGTPHDWRVFSFAAQ
jgi:predicted acetyltransferase